jgi:hypothetical protein
MIRASAVAALLLAAAPAPASERAIEPRSAVTRIAERIEAEYFDPRLAKRIADELRAEVAEGRFDDVEDPRELAAVMSQRLRHHDAHFVVVWSPPSPPAPAVGPGAARAPAADPGAAARGNHGFRRVEVLPGNVGILELTSFAHFEPQAREAPAPPPTPASPEPLAGSAREVADAALALLARTQALIVDLRECGGGSPAMVGYLIGHFVAEDADVYNTFESRGADQSERPTVPIVAPRRVHLPLYVLVSGRTGSGAESFAYTLQAARRATIVGERTAGAANPGDFHPVGDGLSVFVSGGRPVNPITQGNWEGDGVRPDRVVPATDAEHAAYELALETALVGASEGPAALETRWVLEALRAGRDAAPLGEDERRRLAGMYGSRQIAIVGGGLAYQHERRPPRRLLRIEGDTFALEGAPFTRLDFVRGSDGVVVALVVRQVTGDAARFARSTPATR